MEPNYVSLLLEISTTDFIWNVSEKSIHNRIIKAKNLGLKINTPKNWIFFSFPFISLFMCTHFGECWLLAYFAYRCMVYAMYVYVANVHWSRRQYDWMLTIKIKEKNRAQPATHTVKKGKRKGKRKNAKQHNKNCQMKKRRKKTRTHTKNDRIFAENRHHKYVCVHEKAAADERERK